MKPNSAKWRDVLPIHPAAQLLPPLTEEELRARARHQGAWIASSRSVIFERADRSSQTAQGVNIRCSTASAASMRWTLVGIDFEIDRDGDSVERLTIEIEGDFDRSVPDRSSPMEASRSLRLRPVR